MTETTKMKSRLRITDADLLPFRIISQIIKGHYLNHINSLSSWYSNVNDSYLLKISISCYMIAFTSAFGPIFTKCPKYFLREKSPLRSF